MRYLLLSCFILFAFRVAAQCTPEQYQKLLREADGATKRGEYDLAIAKLQSAKVCRPGKEAEVSEKILAVFEKVNGERQEAVRQRERAEAEARRIYANDLAFKSQIALRDGDRTCAFRLAEFAHRYVDQDNVNITRALMEAYYYNDNLSHTPLPWSSNIEFSADKVLYVAFSFDNKYLITGSGDNTVKIWDLESRKAIFTLEQSNVNANVWSFSSDGKRLATSPGDNTVKIWDLRKGQIESSVKDHNHRFVVRRVTFSPNGKFLATGSSDGTVKIWSLESSKIVSTFVGHTSGILSIAFSLDGKHLATGASDGTIKIWDLETGSTNLTIQDHKYNFNTFAFSPDGKYLATDSWNNTAKIWDLKRGNVILTLGGHTSDINSIAFSSNNKYLATGSDDKTAKVWDLRSGNVIFSLVSHTLEVNSVAFSSDNKFLATGSDDRTVKIWDLENKNSAFTFEGHTSAIRCVAFSPDGSYLATGSWDNTAKIWDLESGNMIFTLIGHTSEVNSVAFSPNGNCLATGSADKTVKIWDLENGNTKFTLVDHTSVVNSVAFSPNGRHLASSSADKTVNVWDLENGKMAFTLNDPTSEVRCIAFSPNSKYLATGSTGKTVKIWDLENGNTIFTLHGHTSNISSIAFSPDGKRLATGSYDATIKIWDLKSGKSEFALEEHLSIVKSISFSPDGKRLATCSADRTVKIWDLESGAVEFTIQGHDYDVNSVAFSPDGKCLATGSDDFKAKLWKCTPESLLATAHQKRQYVILFPQLQTYNLLGLLNIKPENEQRLLQTGDALQIAAFAELVAHNARRNQNLHRTASEYTRAARLYNFALKSGGESSLKDKLGELYRWWAADILSSNRPDTATGYIQLACQLNPDKSECPRLWSIFSEKTGKPFDFNRFLSTEDITELCGYGDFFFEDTLQWHQAKLLYEKAKSKTNLAQVLERLYIIAKKTKGSIDFNYFLAEEDTEVLCRFGDFFFNNGEMDIARLLYEKVESHKHSGWVLERLYLISENMGVGFDLNRFLMTEDVGELQGYGDFFFTYSNILYNISFEIPQSGYREIIYENTSNWDKAKPLYEKAETKEHSPMVLIRLYLISEKTGEDFDFNRFLTSEDATELHLYGDFFFYTILNWDKSRLLYEKSESKKHNSQILLQLYTISEKLREEFEFQRFLSSNDPYELARYATYFLQKADTLPNYRDRIPDYNSALLLREKQLTLDTTVALRIEVANEYNSLAFYQLFLPDGAAAEASLRRAYELDPANKYIPTNRAPALLLQGRWAEAEVEYLKWKDVEFGDNNRVNYREVFVQDLDALERQGILHPDFARARNVLSQ